MGTRQKLKMGAEWDVVTSWRHHLCYLCNRAGATSSIKRQMRRRARRERKAAVNG
jgi:hypothetical protein